LIKLLANENVPLEAVKIMRRKDVDIVSVIEFSLGLSDMEVLDLANREGRVLVTFDKDFGELVVREKVRYSTTKVGSL
jgi:predicted nuclease of predicted toxin-antitoxin system